MLHFASIFRDPLMTTAIKACNFLASQKRSLLLGVSKCLLLFQSALHSNKLVSSCRAYLLCKVHFASECIFLLSYQDMTAGMWLSMGCKYYWEGNSMLKILWIVMTRCKKKTEHYFLQLIVSKNCKLYYLTK